MRTTMLARALGAAAIAVLGAGSYDSVKLAYADLLFRRDTEQSIRRATELVPRNARYHARLATLLEDRNAELAELRAAAALNPRAATVWIDLGLRAEMSGDAATGESLLRRAAEVDATYEPKWTLANFYFRQNRPRDFWPWARAAAAIAYGDLTPLFRLCWMISNDPHEILRRAIPNRPPILRQYTAFLLQSGRIEAAQHAAEALGVIAESVDAPVLLEACDRLLEAGQAEGATQLWRRLASRGLIGHEAVDPQRGANLVNGGFALAPSSRGFDWRTPALAGVSISHSDHGHYLRATFSGKQPEQCEPLWQYVPVLPGRAYRLTYERMTSEVRPGSGLLWRVMAGGQEAAQSPELASEGWAAGAMAFTVPAGVQLVRVALSYRRTPGTTRIEGSVSIRNMRLELAP